MAIRPPSIGGAIELQGKPEMYEDITMEQLRYKRKKEDEKAAKDKELLDRYRGSLNVTGYDPIYNEQILTSAAKISEKLNRAQAAKSLNTIESDPEMIKLMSDFKALTGNAKYNSDQLAKIGAEISDVSNRGKINENKDLINAYKEAQTQGRVTPELAKYFGDNAMGVDRNKFYSLVPPTPPDFSAEVIKVTQPITREYDIEKDAGNVFKTTAGRVFEEEANRAQARAIVNTKSSVAGQAALAEAGGDPIKAEELVLENIRFRFDPKYAERISEKSGAGISDSDLKEIPKRRTVVGVGGVAGSPYGGSTSLASFGLKKEVPVTVSINKNAISAVSNAPVSGVDTRAAGSLGEPKVLPTAKVNSLKYGITKGSIITDEKLKQLNKEGVNLSDIVSYEPLAPVSVTEEAIIYNENGEPSYKTEQVLDDDGYPTGQVRQIPATTKKEVTYYLPLKGEIGDTYNQHGYKKAVSVLFDEASKANSEFKQKSSSKYVKGYEENGYRFKGGDPSVQSNWEKIK